MLRERTRKALALLYEAGGITDSYHLAPIRCIDPTERTRLTNLLVCSGLLDTSGQLLRPLDSISLYEILLIVDEGIYPIRRNADFDELPDKNHYPVCKHGMYRTMIRELLTHMKVSEF